MSPPSELFDAHEFFRGDYFNLINQDPFDIGFGESAKGYLRSIGPINRAQIKSAILQFLREVDPTRVVLLEMLAGIDDENSPSR